MTTRSVLIGIFATIILAIATPIGDFWIRGTWLASCHLPVGVLMVFVFLQLVVNPFLHRIGTPLAHSELVTVYAMTLVSAGISSLGFAAYFIPIIIAPTYYQSPENEWNITFFHHVPDWFAPLDTRTARLFFEGTPSQTFWVPWEYWIKPIAAWSVFALGLFLAMTCVCVLLRRQWIERERLGFPLVQLPIEMLGAENQNRVIPAFFRSPAVWIGIALPAIIHTWNGLQFHFPTLPRIPLSYSFSQYLTDKPWNGIRMLVAIIYFSAIGFVYLLPTDLAFSLWFFYLWYLLLAVVMTQFGLPLGQLIYVTHEFAAYQMAGGFLFFTLVILWRARRHLADTIRLTFHPAGRRVSNPLNSTDRSSAERANEPMSPRAAWLGLFVGIGTMTMWSVIAGVSFIVSLTVNCLFLIIMIVMTRLVSEGGMLFIQSTFRPTDLIRPFTGTRPLGAASLTILAYQEMILMFDVRSSMMPSVMDAFKLVDSKRLNQRYFLIPVGVCVVIAMVLSSITVLYIVYRYGGTNLGGWFFFGAPFRAFRRLMSMLLDPQDPSQYNILMMSIGAVITVSLAALRTRFLWWPLHPIGFVMGPSWPMILMWCSVLIGWLCKWVVLRFGGIGLYRRCRPFFLGLVLGEFLTGGLWLIVDFVIGKPGHRIMW